MQCLSRWVSIFLAEPSPRPRWQQQAKFEVGAGLQAAPVKMISAAPRIGED